MKTSCEFSLMEALIAVIFWAIITVITFGIGAFFAVYYFYKAVINNTYLIDTQGSKVGRYECQLEFADILVHILVWIFLSIITFGIAMLFYFFTTLRLCLNKTVVVAQ
jgi:hypothetical protein